MPSSRQAVSCLCCVLPGYSRPRSPVQFSSVAQSFPTLFATPWIAARQASLSITNSRSSLRLTSIESVMPSSHLILCRPLLLLPPIPPSIRVFSTLCMRWPKYWSFSFSIIPSKEIPGLISFRMDWLDFLAVQGTLKSLLWHHNSKASILQCSAFFTVQLSHSYMTTGKTIALTRWTFVGKVMSLLINMLSRLVITFLPRSVFYFFLILFYLTLQYCIGFAIYQNESATGIHVSFNFMAAITICSDFGAQKNKVWRCFPSASQINRKQEFTVLWAGTIFEGQIFAPDGVGSQAKLPFPSAVSPTWHSSFGPMLCISVWGHWCRGSHHPQGKG